MESIQLSQLWTPAAVLAGFQLTALTWRLNREITMERDCEPTWATLADLFVAVSFLVIVVGVFAAPLSGTASSTNMAPKLFVVAMIIFAACPFVLAGHYNLYCSWGKSCCGRPRVTKQELAAVGVSIALGAGGVLWVFCT